MKLLSLISVSAVLILAASSNAEAYDQGYSQLPRTMIDVNGDGQLDYCRFVGNDPDIFIACDLDLGTGEQYEYQSVRGIDQGYSDMPRFFTDANGDGKGDYCRCVGNAPYIFMSCNLGRDTGFDDNQYTYTDYRWSHFLCIN